MGLAEVGAYLYAKDKLENVIEELEKKIIEEGYVDGPRDFVIMALSYHLERMRTLYDDKAKFDALVEEGRKDGEGRE